MSTKIWPVKIPIAILNCLPIGGARPSSLGCQNQWMRAISLASLWWSLSSPQIENDSLVAQWGRKRRDTVFSGPTPF